MGEADRQNSQSRRKKTDCKDGSSEALRREQEPEKGARPGIAAGQASTGEHHPLTVHEDHPTSSPAEEGVQRRQRGVQRLPHPGLLQRSGHRSVGSSEGPAENGQGATGGQARQHAFARGGQERATQVLKVSPFVLLIPSY